jgi:nucleoside-diphosphate-sugar epimerase
VVTERILIAGAGWLGGALARTLLAARYEVVVLRRDAAQLKALAEAGATPLALDLAAPGAAKRIPGAIDAIVACQSAGDDTPDAYRAAYVASNAALLDAAARLRVSAFVYTGSTGVFGQRDGGDVVEGSPPAPSGPAGEVLAEAEGLVLGAAEGGVPARIVRLSGLYGPGRTGIVERVRSGRLALGPGDDAWMNFCHLEDAVAIVVAALLRGEPGRVYHGSDAGPARRREVVEWVAGRLGIPPPRGEVAVPGPNRRIRSEWTRAALGVELRVPTFREGLRDLLASPAP